MKKVIFTIIFFTTLCIQSVQKIIAQSTISEGLTFPVKKKIGFQKMIGADDSGFYMMKQSSVGDGIHISIEKFNKENFNLIFSKETKVAEIQESMNFTPVTVIQTFLSGGKVLVFFESYNIKLKKMFFFLQTVSTEGALSDTYEVSSSYLEFENPVQILGKMFFRVAFSPDQKSFSVVPILGEEKNSKTTFCRLYIASTFEKVWEKPVPIRDRGEKIQTDNFTIDNSGNLLFTIKYVIGNGKNGKKMLGGFALGIIETTSPTVKAVDVDFPDNKVFHDYTIKTLANGDMLLCGIISDTLAKVSKSGFTNPSYFIKRIENNTLATKYEVFDDFSNVAKKQLGESKRGSTFTNTEVIEINGNAYIVSQQTEIMTREYAFAGKYMVDIVTSTNKDLVVAKLTDDGKISWNVVIPKLHLEGGLVGGGKLPRYSGNYKTFVVSNKLNFIFADHPDNIKLEANNFVIENLKPIHGSHLGCETVNAKDKANAVCVSLDENGKSAKSVFLQNVEGGVNYVAIGNTVLLTPKKLLIFLENRKTKIEKFATLNFD